VTSFTAATLNSRVNVRRDFAISDLLDKSLHPYLAVHQSWGTSDSGIRKNNYQRQDDGCLDSARHISNGKSEG
jgi:hypothetical protein